MRLNTRSFINVFYFLISTILLSSCKEQQQSTGSIIVVRDELTRLQDYVDLFPDKVVYVDIWASWCGPCLLEMPHSIKLQQSYEDKEVVFLFLSIDENQKRWKATIQTKNITGQHVFANKQLVKNLEHQYSLEGIPRYLLFNKKGELVNANVDRPSDLLVRAEIDNHL
jgi:thiol-disulfide isomerase/thioredoxin